MQGYVNAWDVWGNHEVLKLVALQSLSASMPHAMFPGLAASTASIDLTAIIFPTLGARVNIGTIDLETRAFHCRLPLHAQLIYWGMNPFVRPIVNAMISFPMHSFRAPKPNTCYYCGSSTFESWVV